MTDVQACQRIIDRLSSGTSVTAQDIYKYLSSEDALLLKQRLAELREQRRWFDEAKKELREYTELLRTADMMNGRAEQLSDSSNRRRVAKLTAGKTLKMEGHSKLYDRAESKYEEALERLSELLAGRQDLTSILDRDFSWDTKPGQETVSAYKDSMPRFAFPFSNSTQVKIEVLREALSNTNGGENRNIEADQQKLRSMLKALKK